MCQTMPAALRRVGHLFTVGWVTTSLVLLSAPAWALNDQDSSAGTDQAIVRERAQTDNTGRVEPPQQTKSSEEKRALEQKPNLSEDVKLRVETYTGNDY